MIIFIQQSLTNQFYHRNGTWTWHREQAAMFTTIIAALKKRADAALQADVVLGLFGSDSTVRFAFVPIARRT